VYYVDKFKFTTNVIQTISELEHDEWTSLLTYMWWQ
jgi:hypothetical protein